MCIRDRVQMYQAMTAPGDRTFAKETAAELERYTLERYVNVLKRGQASGEVRDDICATSLALLLDNQFISLQYSLATDYYEERRQMYVGERPISEVLEDTKKFLRSALTARK